LFYLDNNMEISLCVEYPEEGLDKLHHVDFPVDLVVAGKSMEEFDGWRAQIDHDSVQRVGYWPTLSREEGYWLSTLASPRGLDRVLGELGERNSEDDQLLLLWDAELPHQNPLLVFKNAIYHFKNRKKLDKFLRNHKEHSLDIAAAQFPTRTWPFPLNLVASKPVLEATMTHLDPVEYDLEAVFTMGYTSFGEFEDPINSFLLGGFNPRNLIDEAGLGVKNYRDRFGLALGTIAVGEMGNEPILTPKKLNRDLSIARLMGVKKVAIYRLGGMTDEYAAAIKEACL
jgi:hypothetical protein